MRDPGLLRPHPLTAALPRWRKDDCRFAGFVEDVRARGIRVPIEITPDNQVMDGELRRMASLALDLAEVPCIKRPATEAATIVLASLLQRRHLTKGQRAYLAVPLLEPAFDEARANRLEKLKKGQCFPVVHSVHYGSLDKLADGLGLCRRTLVQARDVHRHFANGEKFIWHKGGKQLTLKDYFEPLILDDDEPAGLGAVLAGIAAKLSGNILDQRASTKYELFREGLSHLRVRFGYWDQFDSKQRAELRPELRELAAKAPADLRAEFLSAFKEAAR